MAIILLKSIFAFIKVRFVTAVIPSKFDLVVHMLQGCWHFFSGCARPPVSPPPSPSLCHLSSYLPFLFILNRFHLIPKVYFHVTTFSSPLFLFHLPFP